jgi:hypothetical protein
MSARHQPMLPSANAFGRGCAPQTSVRSLRNSSALGRARFPALRSGTRHASRNQHWLSPRPCFLGPGYCGRHPPLACPSPARSAQTGRFAGPTVSRAARVRGYESRPRVPHSLHHRYVTGDAPQMSEMDWRITEIGTKVKRIVSVLVTALRAFRPNSCSLLRSLSE